MFDFSDIARTISQLDCLSFSREPRYSLPGSLVGEREGYRVYWRQKPALIIHHLRKKNFELEHAEFILIRPDRHHVISYAVEDDGQVASVYVNINLPPTSKGSDWQWVDLELDLRVRPEGAAHWNIELLDEDEFLEAQLPVDVQQLARAEVKRMEEQIVGASFPFDREVRPYFGFEAERRS